MIGKIFGILCIISVIFGIITGNIAEIGKASVDGAAKAVELTITLAGMMTLWGGVMQVVKKAGIIKKVSKILALPIKLVFPRASKSAEAAEDITAAIAANILGIGNAATPLSFGAMKSMQAINKKDPEFASDDMITFAVMNTAPINLIPTTIITMLRNAGAENPFDILIPVWICSTAGCIFSVMITRTLALIDKKDKKRRSEKDLL